MRGELLSRRLFRAVGDEVTDHGEVGGEPGGWRAAAAASVSAVTVPDLRASGALMNRAAAMSAARPSAEHEEHRDTPPLMKNWSMPSQRSGRRAVTQRPSLFLSRSARGALCTFTVSDEKSLVARLRAGDARAFDEVFLRPPAWPLRLFLRRLTRDDAVAVELTQETWLAPPRPKRPGFAEDTVLPRMAVHGSRENFFLSHRRWSLLDGSRLAELFQSSKDAVDARTPEAAAQDGRRPRSALEARVFRSSPSKTVRRSRSSPQTASSRPRQRRWWESAPRHFANGCLAPASGCAR